MRFKQLLTKTLLAAAGLCVGQSVWGQTVAFSQDFTDNSSTDPDEYGFTITTYNEGAATVTGGLLQYSLPKNSNKDVSACGTASFSAIPTGNVVTVSCSWNPGGPTGTRPYSTLRIYGSDGTEDKVVLSLYNNGQNKKLYLGNYEAGTEIASGNDWRSGSIVWNVVAVLNLNTQKVTSLTITKSGESTPAVSQTNIAFENTVINIDKFEFGTNKKSGYAVTSTLDNVLITYQSAASVADVTFKYEDVDGNDLSAIKADVVEKVEVGSTVSDAISSTLSAAFLNGDESKKYVYNTFTCSDATVPAGGTTVTLKFDALDKFTYNVNAVDGEDKSLGTVATVSGYTGDTKSLSWSKYVKFGDVWYVTSETTFSATATETGSRNVVYAPSDIDYFFEMESLNRSGGAYLTEENASYSKNYRLRLSKSSLYYTSALAGGVYSISIPWGNSNTTANEVYVYARASNGTLSEKLLTFTATGSLSGTFTGNIIVPEGYSIAFNGNEGSANNNARMDYMTLKKTKEIATIGATGWTTFASAYPLDLSSMTASTGEVTAYYASAVGSENVTMTSTDQAAVAAGEGIMLKGTAGATITIPVVANGTAISGNKLVGCTTETELDVNSNYYVLVNNDGKAEFQRLDTNGATIPAGKAYLNASSGAKSLTIVFDNETLGISDAARLNGNAEGMGEKAIYNLSGQRIAAPQKGINIIGGRKVVVK